MLKTSVQRYNFLKDVKREYIWKCCLRSRVFYCQAAFTKDNKMI